MGGHAWAYVVPYREDVARAMNDLREREFAAGRYNPVTPYPAFPDTDRAPAKGARHRSIEEAMKAADASGTRSILDMSRTGGSPGVGVLCPMEDDVLLGLYGTTTPTRAQVEENWDLVEDIGRAEGRYVVLADDDGSPSALLFVGYSAD